MAQALPSTGASPAPEGASRRAAGVRPLVRVHPSSRGRRPRPRLESSRAVGVVLNRARRRRGETLRQASGRSGLPVRYLAAFELDGANRVFRTAAHAEAFLQEYASSLDLDPTRFEGVLTSHPERFAEGAVSSHGLGSGRVAGPLAGWERRREARRLFPPLGGIPSRGVAALAAVLVVGSTFGVLRSRSAADPRHQAVVQAVGGAESPTGVRHWPPELPRGGRHLFPDFRVVAFYGTPLDPRLGRLGFGPPTFAARALQGQAEEYDSATRPVLPALELIGTIATHDRGDSGQYISRIPREVVEAYLAAARATESLLVIDIQPGRSSFLAEAKLFEEFLKEPDVGLALDTEWAVGPDGIPGRKVGSVDAAQINVVGDYLARLVRTYDLPQKLLIVHQFSESMVRNKGAVRYPPELAVTFDLDGVGSQPAKIGNYGVLSRGAPEAHTGIKLYYESDIDVMTPKQVLALDPSPDLVIYQ